MSVPSSFWKSENFIQSDMDVSNNHMFVHLDNGDNSRMNAGNFAERVVVSDVDNAPNINMDVDTDIGNGSFCCRDSVCCRVSGNNNGMCSGPYIPEVDCGYNVYSNGVSINFLKDPFCFRNEFLFGKNSLNENIINSNEYIGENGSKMGSLQNKVHILKPLKKTKIVEVPVYIYKEKIVHKTEVVNKNVYVPTDKPMYVTKEVKVPVYKEQIKYVPTYIEKEKIYEIPKLEIFDLIQQNLLYLHQHDIQYEKNSRVIERVIPRLNTRIVEKTVKVPSIAHRNVSPNTAVVAPTATNTNKTENMLGNVVPSKPEAPQKTSNQKKWEQSKSESNTFAVENLSSNANEKLVAMVTGEEKPSLYEQEKENLVKRQEDLLVEKNEGKGVEKGVEKVEEKAKENDAVKMEEKIEQKFEEKNKEIDVGKIEEKTEENGAGKTEEKNKEINVGKIEEKIEEKTEEKAEEKTEEKAEEKTEEKTEEKAEENGAGKTEAKVDEKAEEKFGEKFEEKVEELNRSQDLPQLSSETHKNKKQINKKHSDVETQDTDTKLKRLHTHVEAVQFKLDADNKVVKEYTKDDNISSSSEILITKYGESKNESTKSDAQILLKNSTSNSNSIL